jgi:hypothetical protein
MLMLRGALLAAVPLAGWLSQTPAQAQVPPSLKGSVCAPHQSAGAGGPYLQGEPPNPGYTSGAPWLEFNINICPGNWFRSESGIYTALLKDNGEFIVARGDPTVAANQAWTTAKTLSGEDQFFYVSKFGYAEVVTKNASYYTFLWNSGGSTYPVKENFFLHLSDAGALTVNYGTPSAPDRQKWSNNINDPLSVARGGVNIESMSYDFENVKAEPPTDQAGGALNCNNTTPTQQQCALKLTLTYTKTSTYTFTSNQSISVGYKSTTKVGLPGVGEGSVEWSVTGTVGFTEGRSDADTQTKTFDATVTITVPPFSNYKALLVGRRVKATIPFVYTGVAAYNSGKTARLVNVPGIYAGVDTGEFNAEISCVSTPGGCNPGVLQRLPVVKGSQGYIANYAVTALRN